ncbi:hypothetical protein PRZ48_006200 [Zasmidium cellare]|uniref:Xylanolytic transcriptional activator regulatory domain-containing protein n=1 Tax=Zasmidium cellare TaxID=395010 RepID=A0ABR0EME9_ZASCE|nr:hypothetical protein PRZ48_006200 [Zasmidium cellare]
MAADAEDGEANAHAHSWPGEREPSRWDVDEANTVPAPTFLARFEAALTHAEASLVAEQRTSRYRTLYGIDHLATAQLPTTSCTYPLALLSNGPVLPPDDELVDLQNTYRQSFERHIFVRDFKLSDMLGSSNRQPPYLQLAVACVAAVFSSPASDGSSLSASEDLFAAGASVWRVVLETDNREARNVQAVVAAMLLCTYGTLSGESVTQRTASGLLSNVITISRRVHLTDFRYPSNEPLPAEPRFAAKNSLISYMVLVDTLHSLHLGTAPCYSVYELFFNLPRSGHPFRTVYHSILYGHDPPPDTANSEDPLVLIIALLTDIVYTQICHSTDALSSAKTIPFRPMSSTSQYTRSSDAFNGALGRWKQHFGNCVEPDILSIFHFARLVLLVPGLYSVTDCTMVVNLPGMSSEAAEVAWIVLDDAEKALEKPDKSMVRWLPIVLYTSGLVVAGFNLLNPRLGGLRSLVMFEHALSRLPWPCSRRMAENLRQLREGPQQRRNAI